MALPRGAGRDSVTQYVAGETMPFEFKLPDLGEGIHEAQIIALKVSEGDSVKEDQPIMEVETDKAAVEIPVPRGGRIARLMVKAGDTVKVGQVLVVVDEAGETAAAPASARPAAASAPPAPRVSVPPAPPVRAAIANPAAARPAVGSDGAVRAAASAAVAAPRVPTHAPITPATPAVVHKGPVPAAPAVRRYARELNVDLRLVPGSGPGGRVTQEDVDRFVRGGGATPPTDGGTVLSDEATLPDERVSAPEEDEFGVVAVEPEPVAAPARPAAPMAPADGLPDYSQWGPIRREAVPQIRKAIARQMMRSWQNVPRVTHGDEADLTELEAFRKTHAEAVAAAGGGKLTITAFVLKALAATLQKHPKLNCSYDGATDEVIWKQYVHIGVAVDSPRGLIVPVLRDADKKSLATIAKELNDLSARIRETKFDIAELRGGTFTLSNVGALGGTFSTPMVNFPETAILVTGRLAKKPVVAPDDRIAIRLMMPLSLSFDHRIIDGADAARFTKTLIEYLEHPIHLLVGA